MVLALVFPQGQGKPYSDSKDKYGSQYAKAQTLGGYEPQHLAPGVQKQSGNETVVLTTGQQPIQLMLFSQMMFGVEAGYARTTLYLGMKGLGDGFLKQINLEGKAVILLLLLITWIFRMAPNYPDTQQTKEINLNQFNIVKQHQIGNFIKKFFTNTEKNDEGLDNDLLKRKIKKKNEFDQTINIYLQNMQGMSGFYAIKKKTKLFAQILQQNLSIAVLTEVKGWFPNWSKELLSSGYRVIQATYQQGQPEEIKSRGGVVVIIKQEILRAKVIATIGNTAIILKITYLDQNRRKSHFMMIAVYINPQPNVAEQNYIENTFALIEHYITETSIPIICLGDFNTNGIKILKPLTKTYALQRHLEGQITRLGINKIKNEIYESQPDEVVTKNLNLGKIKIQEFENGGNYSDHLGIYMEIEGFQIDFPQKIYTRKSVKKCMANPIFLEQFVMGPYPMLGTEQLVSRIEGMEMVSLGAQIRKIKNINFSQPLKEIQETILSNNKQYSQQIQEKFRIAEVTGSNEDMLAAIKMVQGKSRKEDVRGDGLHVVKYYHDEVQNQLKNQRASNQKIAQLYNEFYSEQGNIKEKVISTENHTINSAIQILLERYQPKEYEKNKEERLQIQESGIQIFDQLRKEIIARKLIKSYDKLFPMILKCLKSISLDKAHGNDLIQANIRKQHVKIVSCDCKEYLDNQNKQSSMLEKFETAPRQIVTTCGHLQEYYEYSKSYKANDCGIINKKENEIRLDELISDRLTLMVIMRRIPLHFYNSKIAMFSKSGSCVVKSIDQIRPIGVLPVFYKVIEKAFKLLIDTEYPQLFQVGIEQAGFTKGRTTWDHITTVMQRISQSQMLKQMKQKKNHKLWVFLDIVGAYNHCKHDLILKILRKRTNDWMDPLAEIFMSMITQSYEFGTISIGENLLHQRKGLIQGGGISPDIFKLYIDDLLEKDSFMNEKMKNHRKMAQSWTEGKRNNRNDSDIALLFADDIYAEFKDVNELQKWDEYRQPLWDKYGLKINLKQGKTQILTQDLKAVLKNEDGHWIETRNNKYHVVRNVKYLGANISLDLIKKSKSETQKIRLTLEKKLAGIIKNIQKWRIITNYNIRQVFVESLFRYYITPYVMSGIISPQEGLETWQRLQKKMLGINKAIKSNIVEAIVPQPNWIMWWWEMIQKSFKIYPLYNWQALITSFSKPLRAMGISIATVKNKSYHQMLKQPLGIYVDPKYDQSKIIMNNERRPEMLCQGCPNQWILRRNWTQIYGQAIKGAYVIFTDGSYRLSSRGQKYASIGYYLYEERTEQHGFHSTYAFAAELKWDRNENHRKRFSNNVAELMAIYEAIKYIKKRGKDEKKVIMIVSDSEYAIKSITEWHKKWLYQTSNISTKQRKNLDIICRILDEIDERHCKSKIQFLHVRAHKAEQNFLQYGNSIADYLADTVLTGLTNPPTVKVKLPKVDQEDPEGLCEYCKLRWKNAQNQERQQILAELRYISEDRRRNPPQIEPIQEVIELFKTKFNKDHTASTRERREWFRHKFRFYLEKQPKELDVWETITLVTTLDSENIDTGRMRFLPHKYKMIQELWEELPEEQQEELEENLMLTEKVKTLTKQQEIYEILEYDDYKTMKELLEQEDGMRNGQNEKLMLETQIDARLLQELRQSPLYKSMLFKFGMDEGKVLKMIKKKKVRNVDWEAIEKTGMVTPLSMRIRRQVDSMIKNIQWSEVTMAPWIKRDYLRQISTTLAAIQTLSGFGQKGIRVCSKCYEKMQYERATPAHQIDCIYEEARSLTRMGRAIEAKGLIKDRLMPWVRIWAEYKILRDNLIDPRLVKHLAFVVGFGKRAWNLIMKDQDQKNSHVISKEEWKSEFEENPLRKLNSHLRVRPGYIKHIKALVMNLAGTLFDIEKETYRQIKLEAQFQFQENIKTFQNEPKQEQHNISIEKIWNLPAKNHRKLLRNMNKSLESYLKARKNDLENLRKSRREMTILRKRELLDEINEFKIMKGRFNLSKFEFLKDNLDIHQEDAPYCITSKEDWELINKVDGIVKVLAQLTGTPFIIEDLNLEHYRNLLKSNSDRFLILIAQEDPCKSSSKTLAGELDDSAEILQENLAINIPEEIDRRSLEHFSILENGIQSKNSNFKINDLNSQWEELNPQKELQPEKIRQNLMEMRFDPESLRMIIKRKRAQWKQAQKMTGPYGGTTIVADYRKRNMKKKIKNLKNDKTQKPNNDNDPTLEYLAIMKANPEGWTKDADEKMAMRKLKNENKRKKFLIQRPHEKNENEDVPMPRANMIPKRKVAEKSTMELQMATMKKKAHAQEGNVEQVDPAMSGRRQRRE